MWNRLRGRKRGMHMSRQKEGPFSLHHKFQLLVSSLTQISKNHARNMHVLELLLCERKWESREDWFRIRSVWRVPDLWFSIKTRTEGDEMRRRMLREDWTPELNFRSHFSTLCSSSSHTSFILCVFSTSFSSLSSLLSLELLCFCLLRYLVRKEKEEERKRPLNDSHVLSYWCILTAGFFFLFWS